MLKKSLLVPAGILALMLVPFATNAQTASNTAPLGSKQNPIKPTSVGTPQPNGNSSKGKRGSKTNPVTGSVHPRTSN